MNPIYAPAAFPGTDSQETGMTLLDYFAGQALPAMLVDDGGSVAYAAAQLGIPAAEYDGKIHWPQLAARYAYSYAEAMMAERAKRAAKATPPQEPHE